MPGQVGVTDRGRGAALANGLAGLRGLRGRGAGGLLHAEASGQETGQGGRKVGREHIRSRRQHVGVPDSVLPGLPAHTTPCAASACAESSTQSAPHHPHRRSTPPQPKNHISLRINKTTAGLHVASRERAMLRSAVGCWLELRGDLSPFSQKGRPGGNGVQGSILRVLGGAAC